MQAPPVPPFRQLVLANGIPVYLVRFGPQPVIGLQLVFRAGHSYEPLPGVDGLMCRMLNEGTANYSGLQIAQQLDACGAFFSTNPGFEVTSLSLSGLAHRIGEVLPLLQDIVLNATFPEPEWNLMRQRTLQQMDVEEQKTGYHARRAFLHGMYGSSHPYGSHTGRQEFLAVERQHVQDYYRNVIRPGNCSIIVAGLYDEDSVIAQLEQYFGRLQPNTPELISRAGHIPAQPEVGTRYIPLPGNLQSAVRVGHGGMPRNHPDYHGMRMVTTILGGYFGSRLMQNIREEKGYTYGIGAHWVSMKHGGYFGVSTDVGNAYVPDTLAQIRLEIERLRQDLVPEAELELARNYLLGRILSEQETCFQIADLLRSHLANELPLTTLNESFQQLQALTPTRIRELAQQYLHPDQLLEVVCGAM